jgi:hypothetical protein
MQEKNILFFRRVNAASRRRRGVMGFAKDGIGKAYGVLKLGKFHGQRPRPPGALRSRLTTIYINSIAFPSNHYHWRIS